jgi:hypothetical protein
VFWQERGYRGLTPLQAALANAEHGGQSAAELLQYLERGNQLGALWVRDDAGRTVLHTALEHANQLDEQVLVRLVELGGRRLVQLSLGRPPSLSVAHGWGKRVPAAAAALLTRFGGGRLIGLDWVEGTAFGQACLRNLQYLVRAAAYCFTPEQLVRVLDAHVQPGFAVQMLSKWAAFMEEHGGGSPIVAQKRHTFPTPAPPSWDRTGPGRTCITNFIVFCERAAGDTFILL